MSVTPLRDSHGRVVKDLRISVTDRCNFRCHYCMPSEGVAHSPRDSILSFEEILRLARLFVATGVDKLRITGGEPLLRRGLLSLVAELARIPGVRDLAMTTNGYFLAEQAEALAAAGLGRVSISLDSLRRDRFQAITGIDGLDRVLAAISRCQELGLEPVKLNMVVMRDVNADEVAAMANLARTHGCHVRFIEFMPLEGLGAWNRERVVSADEMLERIGQEHELELMPPDSLAQTARNYRFCDGSPGVVGFIASVSRPFCGHCNRLRLTTDGHLRTCLFSLSEHDLRAMMRGGMSDEALGAQLAAIVWGKEAGHRVGKPDFVPPVRTMSCIGG